MSQSGGFHPGERVVILEGAFARMSGTVISPDEAAARWPPRIDHPEVDRGECYWVVIEVFGREVPILQQTEWLIRASSP